MNIIEDEFQFDVRIQERLLKKGVIKKEELEQRLAALEDKEDESEPLELDQPGLLPSEPEAEAAPETL